MRPLSRGTLRLASPQPFTPPSIDPRYGSNPIDLLVLREAINFNTRLIATESMSLLLPTFSSPRATSTDDEIMEYIRARGQTEYHPSGSAAMMPLEMGGVVDPELLVYGTRNLRVVDASVMPLVPAGHLQAVVYGVAEKVRSFAPRLIPFLSFVSTALSRERTNEHRTEKKLTHHRPNCRQRTSSKQQQHPQPQRR
jgi:choline dehydrogenase